MCRLAGTISVTVVTRRPWIRHPAPQTPVFCWSIIKRLSIFISSLKFSIKFCTAGASNAKSLPPRQQLEHLTPASCTYNITNPHISSVAVSSIKCCSVAHDFADDWILGAASLVANGPFCLRVCREHHLHKTCATVANQIRMLLISIQSWASWWSSENSIIYDGFDRSQ